MSGESVCGVTVSLCMTANICLDTTDLRQFLFGPLTFINATLQSQRCNIDILTASINLSSCASERNPAT
jgi:hypothetical protein